jgi:hypothetical protein
MHGTAAKSAVRAVHLHLQSAAPPHLHMLVRQVLMLARTAAGVDCIMSSALSAGIRPGWRHSCCASSGLAAASWARALVAASWTCSRRVRRLD